MKKSAFIVSFMCVLIVSCGTRKMLISSSNVDSVATTHEKEYVERWRVDTVVVEIPGASAERIVFDSTSVIRRQNASTTACIRPDGSLYHDLFVEPLKMPVPVKVKDTETKLSDTKTHMQIERVEIPVKLPLTWWERFWWTSGKVGWGVVFALFAGLLFKIFRR